MGTLTVRKFGISLDPQELVDFAEKLDYFTNVLSELGFEQNGTYTFRYADDECMMKAETVRSRDGYYLYVYVQAIDEHEYRIKELADSFGAHIVDGAKRPV